MGPGLRRRVALVMEASKGIGLAVAQALAREGCALTLVARSAEDLRQAVECVAKVAVAEGDREDIDWVAEAARRVFDGLWRRAKPFKRQTLLLRLADPVEQHFDEPAALDMLDTGAPISRTKASRLRTLGMLRDYAGQATAPHGETIENSLPGDYVG